MYLKDQSVYCYITVSCTWSLCFICHFINFGLQIFSIIKTDNSLRKWLLATKLFFNCFLVSELEYDRMKEENNYARLITLCKVHYGNQVSYTIIKKLIWQE